MTRFAKDANAYAQAHLATYQESQGEAAAARAAKRGGAKRSLRAGLIFPITRSQKRLRALLDGPRTRVSSDAGVYLAGAVEFFVKRILDEAGLVAEEAKKTRIVPRHLKIGFERDNEWLGSFALANNLVLQGGVVPEIHAALLPKEKKSRSKKALE